jgi:hypothetical protein
VTDSDVVFRRLSDTGPNMIAVDELTGTRRPTSGAFAPDEDGVSVYVEAVLAARDLTAKDIVRAAQNVVASIEVREIRALDLDIKPDPWPPDSDDPDHPRNAAHALIVGLELLGAKQRRRRQRELALLNSLTCVYPPGAF